jgi:hypothetical protein
VVVTPEQKRENRQARHELAAAAHKAIRGPQRAGGISTPAQVRKFARVKVDRLLRTLRQRQHAQETS